MAIKAIVFDCFGVLVVEAWVPLRDELFANDRELLEQANDNMKRLSLGYISVEEFASHIAAISDLSKEEVFDRMHANPINRSLFEYIHTLKSSYQLAILSNVGANRVKELLGEENMKLFDVIGLSYDMGVAKPDPLAYTTIAAQLALEPSECVFTDDQPRFVDGAVAIGMNGIVFHDTVSFRRELKEMLA